MASEESSAEKSPEQVIAEYLAGIGRKGGLKGGKARAEKLSAEERKEIARLGGIKRAEKARERKEKEQTENLPSKKK